MIYHKKNKNQLKKVKRIIEALHKMFGLNFVRSSLDKIIHRVSPGPVSIDQDQKFPPLPLTAHSPPLSRQRADSPRCPLSSPLRHWDPSLLMPECE